MRAQLFLCCFLAKVAREECLNLWKKIFSSFFSCLDLFPQVFRQVKECLALKLHEMVRVQHEVSHPFIFIWFYGRHLQGGELKLMKRYHIFSIFSRFCPFAQVFGKVNDWSISEVHEKIRVLYMVACTIFFNCRDWQGRMFKFMKNDNFLNIFMSFGLFPKVFGQVNEWLMLEVPKTMSVTCNCVPNSCYFVLWAKLAGTSVESDEQWFFSVFSRWALFPKILGRLRCHLC